MKCEKCGNEDCQILQEKKPLGAGTILLSILLFPIGLIFLLVRDTKTVAVCKKCGNKFDIC